MFHVEDSVMYGSYGVCQIVDIRSEKFDRDAKLYYVLKPVQDKNSTFYCPVESGEDKMRKILSIGEIHQLIKAMPDAQTKWIENEQLRKEKYGEIIRRGDHKELVQLIKTLYYKKQEKKQEGKKFHVADEKAMKEAERILHGEFAYVLKIKPDDVVPLIMGQINHIGEQNADAENA